MVGESSDNFITFRCECGQLIKAPVARAGAQGRCKVCGRRMTVPSPDGAGPQKGPQARSGKGPRERQQEPVSPVYRRDREGEYTEEDLITYPYDRPVRKEAPAPVEEKKSLFGMLGEILRYPFSDQQATQIFLAGAVLFSPLMWLPMKLFRRIPCLGIILILVLFIAVISIRLMYFSYLLLIIEHSAAGDRRIPELPVFQSWDEHLADLIKVLGASAVAFAPYLVYAASVNIEVLGRMLEAYSRGAVPGADVMGDVSSNLGVLVLLYATAAFYMPMVLMALVVTRSFAKAVSPAFIARSILRVRGEYLAAMLIIFLLLRTVLTLFTVLKDVLAADWIAVAAGYVAEPILKFYVFVVTMHVIGLLYYRNKEKLEW